MGEQWKHGAASVAEEHQFTSFCEGVFDLIEERLRLAVPIVSGQQSGIFLLNTYGNRHTFAIRILLLWFKSLGIDARMLNPEPSPEYLVEAIRRTRPRLILISIKFGSIAPIVGVTFLEDIMQLEQLI